MSKNTGLIADKLRSERVGPVTFHVAHGECLAITGASGSGKSLLLRLVADLDPHTGTLTLDGENSLSMAGHVWRQRVAYFPAEPGWWSENVSDHIADTPQARALISAVGLPERMLTAELRGLSTGERQRLALVRGPLHDPQVLLLDEPTSALDPQSTSLVEDLITRQKHEGRIIVLVSHNAAQVERLADRRAILRDGRLAEVA
ncbi:ABC transporter ATP-binding protein [Acetobacter aceti]|uniref:ABC transporter ATP-binding protein n=1 Tax=Acetobacter aceti TaxID=435 RepID=A0A6S6PKU9_ACEAC|nr:ATP-binding cassette domain-containing protein [Acetobacter aceti]BCI67295.1 ABC transporter ATP-binding protein [Acetobacter aceti]